MIFQIVEENLVGQPMTHRTLGSITSMLMELEREKCVWQGRLKEDEWEKL